MTKPNPLDRVLGDRIKSITFRDVERQLNLFEHAGVPLTPKGTSPMNNHLARSPLFSPLRRGKRPMRNNELLVQQGDFEIRYSGPALDMRDQDVFLEALRRAAGRRPHDEMAGETPSGESQIAINRAEFLESIGMDKSGASYRFLEKSFFRLHDASLKFIAPPVKVAYHLIGGLWYNENDGTYYYYIPKSSYVLFLNDGYGFVNMDRRFALENRVDIAKWIQAYAVSNAKGEYSIELERLRDRCGYAGRLRDFRMAVREALAELVRVGEFSRAKLDDDDMVIWSRWE